MHFLQLKTMQQQQQQQPSTTARHRKASTASLANLSSNSTYPQSFKFIDQVK